MCSEHDRSQPSRRFGAMMRKLDQRGVAAFEFCLVFVPLFTLMFAIFDLGRYAITMQSLRTLANAGARATMINCYTPAVIAHTSPSSCTAYLPSCHAKARCCPVPVCRRSYAYSEHGFGSRCTYGYGVSTRFHHDDADMGHNTNAPSASTSVPF